MDARSNLPKVEPHLAAQACSIRRTRLCEVRWPSWRAQTRNAFKLSRMSSCIIIYDIRAWVVGLGESIHLTVLGKSPQSRQISGLFLWRVGRAFRSVFPQLGVSQQVSSAASIQYAYPASNTSVSCKTTNRYGSPERPIPSTLRAAVTSRLKNVGFRP